MALSTLREGSEQPQDATPHPFRVNLEQYYKMAEIGIFAPDERVELIDGIVYKMQPISPKHAYTVKRLSDSLSDCAGENAVTLTQSPLQIGNDNEPQPDLLIVKPPLERYAERHPRPEDVLLVIEVAHATLQSDRTLKLQLYASAGIPEYWIVNLHKPQLEIHRDPDTDEARYREGHTLAEGEVAEPLGLEGCEVAWWR